MPKFDVVVGNPPYLRDTHLKFLKLADDIIADDGKIVWVHPARWIQDPLAPLKKNSDYNKYRDLPFRSFQIIPNKKAREIFGIGITSDVVISYLEKGKNSILIEDEIYKLRGIPSSLKKVFRFDLPSINDAVEKNKRDGIRVQIREIMPNFGGGAKYRYYLINKRDNIAINGLINGKEWHQITSKNQYEKPKGAPFPYSIRFNTVREAKNFIDSTYTDYFSFLMFLSKVDVHVQLKYLPFMKDYKDPWTDDRFKDYFNITNEEMNFIKNIMKKKNVKMS